MALSLDDFLTLRSQLPVVDVRSPLEYAAGHMRGVTNIPLLNNEERVQVGTDYKQKGQREAIKTGFRLVGPRLLDIINETEKVGRNIIVHCWRGGMRSNNFCQFVGMAGVKAQPLTGGYKAYRQRAMDSYRQGFQFRIIGGFTGSGKSDVLRELKRQGAQVIDLEALAHHKGSAFGGLTMPPQPTTEQFQNELFEKIFSPAVIWKTMSASPVVEMQVSQDVRLERLVGEYGPAERDAFLAAMTNVTKKLGGQNFKLAKEKLEAGDMHTTIRLLLTYYDKAYLNGLERKKGRIQLQVPWDGHDLSKLASQLLADPLAR